MNNQSFMYMLLYAFGRSGKILGCLKVILVPDPSNLRTVSHLISYIVLASLAR